MSQLTVNPPPARTWRDIPQPMQTRIMGKEGKKRLAMAIGNVVGLVLLLVASGWGIYEVIGVWETNPTRITAAASGVPLKDISIRTDGVLDKAWVTRTLDIPKGATLMALNLRQLQQNLLATGQVQSAVVTRKFPDLLVVTLQERSPVARVMAQLGGTSAPQALMVARDGSVYVGSGYERTLADALPFLDGVKLIREGSGYARIDGMEQVSDLLGAARSNTPGLYRTFRVVSLARFTADGTILVKSTEVEEIAFGLREDFMRQLARLDYILEETRRQTPVAAPLKAVNLAVGGNKVPVAFDTPVVTADGSAPRTAVKPAAPVLSGTALFSLPNRNSSSSKRDF